MSRAIIKAPFQLSLWLAKAPPIIAFDTETTSLDYMTQELVGVSFCYDNEVCYVDLYESPYFNQLIETIQCHFPSFKMLIGHNISYDLKVFKKYNILPNSSCIFFCTQVAAHLLDENNPKNINYLAKKHFGMDLGKWEKVREFGYHSQKFYDYGLMDAYVAYKLFLLQHTLLELEGLSDLFFDIEMKFIPIKVGLESEGFFVDQDRMHSLQIQLKGMLDRIQINLCEIADVDYYYQDNFMEGQKLTTGVNFNSSKQLAKLIKKLGIKIKNKTPGGEPSTSAESLREIKNEHPFIPLLLKYKTLQKLYNTYVFPFPSYIDIDGRIRCNWQNTVAVTGRVTTSKPNLLNLPRKGVDLSDLGVEENFDFRSCFAAPDGKVLVCCDYSGQELCWLGEVSNDPILIKAIADGKDLHLTTANIIFTLNIPDDCLYKSHPKFHYYKEKFAKERYAGKNGVNFPLIYGKTEFGIAKDFNITKKEAGHWLNGFFQLYPDVKKSIAACHNEVDRMGEVVNWFGRKRRFPNKSDIERCYRQSFNFLVQGPSAEQIKLAAIGVQDCFNQHPEWDAKIVLVVYDEIVYEINEDFYEQSIPLVRSIMENCVKTKVPFTVDVGVGQNYGEAK